MDAWVMLPTGVGIICCDCIVLSKIAVSIYTYELMYINTGCVHF